MKKKIDYQEQGLSIEEELGIVDIQVGVDWLTVTAKSREQREQLFAATKTALDAIRKNAPVKKWVFRGYTGWRCEGIRWGTRADSDICVLSGYDAEVSWYRFLPAANNVTRVDLQVTCALKKPLLSVATLCYDWLCANKDLPFNRNYSLIQTSGQGETLYVGSRLSDQCGRLYDKGIEKGVETPGLLWRYEVEFKAERAKRIAERLCKFAGTHQPREAVRNEIAETVRLWFDARLVPPLWAYVNDEPMVTDISARVTSDELTLIWLSKQIRPSILGLQERGKLNQTLSALGLDFLIQEHKHKVKG